MSNVAVQPVLSPKNVIITDDGRKYQKPDADKVFLGVTSGLAASQITRVGLSLPSMPILSKMGKISQTLDSVELKKALDSALDISGMKSKGVKIIDYSGSVYSKPADSSFFGKIKDFFLLQHNACEAAKRGTNAFFVSENKQIGYNQIHINTEKFAAAGFHEIGHSINYNKSKFLGLIQKAKTPLMYIPLLLTGIALCKRKKADGEKPVGFFDKAATFIKNNVGILSSTAMLPILGEELIATFKGNKLAKQLLSPENYNKIVKTNCWGAITYSLAVVAAGIAAYIANKVKDTIAAPKEIKQ